MLATNEAYNIIKNSNIPGIDDVYTINIPREKIDNVDETIVLITDANTSPELYGNDQFGGLQRQIEVQIFYKLHPDIDPEALDVKLYRVLEKHGWYVAQNRGHTFDPDTNQLTSTFYVTNHEIL